ncbi:MAG: glycosyltransferase [Candidatus Levyibacteriota bacterium]
MKILFVADTYPPQINGAGNATRSMALWLLEKGNNVSVVAPSTSLKNFTEEKDGMTIYRVSSLLVQKAQSFRVSPQVMHWKKLQQIIQEVQPDVIHVNSPGFLAQSAIKIANASGIAIVGTAHFMPENLTHYLHMPYPIENAINKLAWREYAGIYSKLDMITAPTQTAADLLLQFPIIKKVVVISNGIDFVELKKMSDKETVRKKFGLPHDPLLLFVGRIEKEKNIDVFLKAAKLLKNRTFHIVIVGKGKELELLQDLAEKLGIAKRVTLTGFVSDPDASALYALSSIFVMPSIAELQSLTTMNAMAFSLPIIAANAVALPHLVHSDQNGFLFKPKDVQDLAKKLDILLADPELSEKMGKKSREMIAVHDKEHVVKEMEDVYQQAIVKSKEKIMKKKRKFRLPVLFTKRKLAKKLLQPIDTV